MYASVATTLGIFGGGYLNGNDFCYSQYGWGNRKGVLFVVRNTDLYNSANGRFRGGTLVCKTTLEEHKWNIGTGITFFYENGSTYSI